MNNFINLALSCGVSGGRPGGGDFARDVPVVCWVNGGGVSPSMLGIGPAVLTRLRS